MPKCPNGKAINPATNRCVLMSGRVYRKIVEDGSFNKGGKIINPLTGRLIDKDGAVYKKLEANGVFKVRKRSVNKVKSPVKTVTKSPVKTVTKSPVKTVTKSSKSPASKSPVGKIVAPTVTPSKEPYLDEDFVNSINALAEAGNSRYGITKGGYEYIYKIIKHLVKVYNISFDTRKIKMVRLADAEKVTKANFSDYTEKIVAGAEKIMSGEFVLELPENLVYDNLDRSLKYSQNAIKYIEAIIEEIVTQLLDGYPNKITERSIQRVLKSNYVLAKIFGEDYQAI